MEKERVKDYFIRVFGGSEILKFLWSEWVLLLFTSYAYGQVGANKMGKIFLVVITLGFLIWTLKASFNTAVNIDKFMLLCGIECGFISITCLRLSAFFISLDVFVRKMVFDTLLTVFFIAIYIVFNWTKGRYTRVVKSQKEDRKTGVIPGIVLIGGTVGYFVPRIFRGLFTQNNISIVLSLSILMFSVITVISCGSLLGNYYLCKKYSLENLLSEQVGKET